MYGNRRLSLFVSILCLPMVCIADEAKHNPLAKQITAAEMRKLDAGSGELVSVTATVCYQDPLWKFLFLTDQGHGVFVDPVPGSYQPGDRLQISGPVCDGHGVPIFRDDVVVTKVGHVPLPDPAQVDLSEWDWDHGFADKRNTGWVELEGRVEQITLIDNSTRLWCRGKHCMFAVTIAEAMELEKAWSHIGAKIRFRGSLGILLDRHNWIHAPLLLTQNLSFITTVEPSAGVPFPERANERISYTTIDDNDSFRTSGTVTLRSSGKLFLDDGFSATSISVASSFETPIDSFVEVLGTSDKSGKWYARVLLLRNETLEIWPMQLGLSDLGPQQIGRRIQIRAQVTRYDAKVGRLDVQQGGAMATVILPQQNGKEVRQMRPAKSGTASLDLATAKEVDVFGVLEKIEDGLPVIRAMSHDDVRVISNRWVLASNTLLRLLGVFVAFLLGVCAVVLWLRRLVAARTQALSDLAAQLRASYDSVDAGVVAVGTDGKLLTVNEMANSLLQTTLAPGDTADDFIDSWSDIADEPATVYEMASAFRSEQKEPSVCGVSLKDGRGRLRLKLTAINRDGKHVGNLWVMHDETQLQSLQAELFQAQKMEAVGTLAGGIAHDFNNLLTAILGNLSLLSITQPDDVERHSFIEQAEAACMSAGELVQQLLGLSRKSSMKQKVVDPNELVNKFQSLLRHGFDSDITLEFRTTLDVPSVYIDPTQIEQVLLNLCVNARDAMPRGGKITIATEQGVLHDQSAVVIRVHDTGEGIPRPIQDKIFEPFFTTKGVGKGTGLGLATSFSVVNRHNGELRFESTPGKGTTFCVVLPAATEEEVLREELMPQLESLKGNETILVVDDEWVVRTVAANLLQSGGYRTIEAKDGLSGLELLSDSQGEIDLVLLDVTMPEMSGHETLREIRRLYPSLPVLMCSGYDLRGDGELSFDHFVAKPFSASSLFRAIRSTLDKPKPSVAN